MTSSRSGIRARLQRCVGGAAALAAVVGILAAGTAASPAVAAAEDEESGVVELHLSAGVHGVVHAGDPLTATITVTNGTQEELSSGFVRVELSRSPLTDAASVLSWMDEGTAAGSFEPIGTESSKPVTAAGSAVETVVAGDELTTLRPGVYPLRAALNGATTGDLQDDSLLSRDTAARSVLIVDDDDDTTEAAVLVPITATPADGVLLTADELATLTADDGALTAQLDGLAGTTATVAVDPAIPAAIRALGREAPASAIDWLSRLQTLPNDRFALQFADADAAVQAQAGLPELLGALPLTPFLDPAAFEDQEAGPTPGPTPTDADDPDAGEPALPDNAALTMVRGETPNILWPTGDVSTDDLTAFSGYLGSDVTTILPSGSVDGGEGPHRNVDGNDVLVADAAASDALSSAAAETDELAREDRLATGLGLLAASGAPATLIGLDRNEAREADALHETLSAVATLADPVALGAMQTADTTRASIASEPDPGRATDLQAMLNDEQRLSAFSSILDDRLLLLSPERIRLLRTIAVGSAATFEKDFAARRSHVADVLASVGIQDQKPIQLLTSAAPLPVWIRNDLPWPVSLQLSARPSDTRLYMQARTEVQAQPASNTLVKVPVEARVGSGALRVEFGLTSPTGVPIGRDQTANVTVRAEWEGIGLGVLGAVIGALLVLGVLRTVLRRRRGDRDVRKDGGR